MMRLRRSNQGEDRCKLWHRESQCDGGVPQADKAKQRTDLFRSIQCVVQVVHLYCALLELRLQLHTPTCVEAQYGKTTACSSDPVRLTFRTASPLSENMLLVTLECYRSSLRRSMVTSGGSRRSCQQEALRRLPLRISLTRCKSQRTIRDVNAIDAVATLLCGTRALPVNQQMSAQSHSCKLRDVSWREHAEGY